MTKYVEITRCDGCPHHRFDKDDGPPEYYGKYICSYWSYETPVILADSLIIPDWCPLPNSQTMPCGEPVDLRRCCLACVKSISCDKSLMIRDA